MKKILAAIFIILALPVWANAFPMIYAGSQQVQFGFEHRDDDWLLEFGYGRFITDELLLGALFSYEDNARTIWSAGGTMELHFNLGTMTYPYFSIIAIYQDYDIDDHILFGPAAGINHFITDYLSVDIKARYLLSSESRYDEDLEIIGGLRVLF